MYPEFEVDKRRLKELEELIGKNKIKNNEILNELENLINKTKEELAQRKDNINKYNEALNDIKNIYNEIKSGKKPEELTEQTENVKNKINSITDDKLKE